MVLLNQISTSVTACKLNKSFYQSEKIHMYVAQFGPKNITENSEGKQLQTLEINVHMSYRRAGEILPNKTDLRGLLPRNYL